MQRQFVESTMIEWIGYDPASRKLTIRFRTGGLYEYYEVPREEYVRLVRASSHGRYFLANIRNAYPYSKLR